MKKKSCKHVKRNWFPGKWRRKHRLMGTLTKRGNKKIRLIEFLTENQCQRNVKRSGSCQCDMYLTSFSASQSIAKASVTTPAESGQSASAFQSSSAISIKTRHRVISSRRYLHRFMQPIHSAPNTGGFFVKNFADGYRLGTRTGVRMLCTWISIRERSISSAGRFLIIINQTASCHLHSRPALFFFQFFTWVLVGGGDWWTTRMQDRFPCLSTQSFSILGHIFIGQSSEWNATRIDRPLTLIGINRALWRLKSNGSTGNKSNSAIFLKK